RQDRGIKLILDNRLCEVTADRLKRSRRVHLHPCELRRFPSNRAKAASDLDANFLQLGKAGRRSGRVGAVAINATLRGVQAGEEILETIVTLETLSGEDNRA